MKLNGAGSLTWFNQLRKRWGGRGLKLWLGLALIYLAITLAFTYPVVLHLGTQPAGELSTSSDTLQSVWGIWWWQHALLDLHQNPLVISVLNWPANLSYALYPLMAQTYLLGLPVAAVASPVLAYNLIFLAGFVASALAAYGLCVEISGDRRAAFIGGLIWAFFPTKMAHALAGHLALINLFSVPLMAWALLRALRAPTRRAGLLAGLAITLAATIHPIYLAYAVAPIVLVLILDAWRREGRAFWQRERLRALFWALGVPTVCCALMIAPTVRQVLQGTWSDINPAGDVVGFSPDLLGYFVPSIDNPLIRLLGLHDFALKVMPYQYAYLIYLGWVPLLCAVWGLRHRPAEGRLWGWFGLGAAILALGPLLKLGGDLAKVKIAGQAYAIVMPYALVANSPVLSLSRTPSRLLVLVMLAVAVLATLGVSRLLQGRKLAAHSTAVLTVISAVILFEYVARFPFPTADVVSPAPLQALRSRADQTAVMQFPQISYQDNQRMLYWQTIHQHPVVGGRVYRLTDVQRPAGYYALLRPPAASSLILSSTGDQRRAALSSAGIGWVLYDAQADAAGTERGKVQQLLGSPEAEADGAALFPVPPSSLQPDETVWALGDNWEPGDAGQTPAAWRFCRSGVVYVFAGAARLSSLTFQADPGPDVRQMTLRLNGRDVGTFVVGDQATLHTNPLQFDAGLNVIEFVEPEVQPGVVDAQLCDTADVSSASWSAALSGLQIEGASAASAPPAGAVFGDAMRLAGFTLPASAAPGGRLIVHLLWQAAAPPGDDLTAFLHVEDMAGQLVAQNDRPPTGGLFPTSTWTARELVSDRSVVELPSDLAPGTYRVKLGVYRQPTLERLPVTGAPASDDTVLLGSVVIER